MFTVLPEPTRQMVNKFVFNPYRCLSFVLFHSLFFFFLSFFFSSRFCWGQQKTVKFKRVAEKSFAPSAFNTFHIFSAGLLGNFMTWNETVLLRRFVLIPILTCFRLPAIYLIWGHLLSFLFEIIQRFDLGLDMGARASTRIFGKLRFCGIPRAIIINYEFIIRFYFIVTYPFERFVWFCWWHLKVERSNWIVLSFYCAVIGRFSCRQCRTPTIE